MASTATKRIQKELAELMGSPLSGITVAPDGDNLMHWKVTMKGPPKTPYAGGKFGLDVVFGPEFPFKAPTITYSTKMYHPNIDSDGNICIGVLKSEAWKPSTKMSIVLLSLYDLLETPNPDDPLVSSIYRNDRKGFDAKAKEYSDKYAA
ncbi:uncharacterized protein EHS24_000072 [Apiotrichum porosum]|uniref:E2 ubiquitin-conjugating enzyme n=1 Tax=Apiotrichum porosum TaxID=105984 RepID=A0A427Y8W0_9TREE|nr:uncharacterized protein EHS24_000072 [Apiotrichum porosum]RSH87562.1 hypothetical protein EHS24_000072 [Apiotrichum porosum]